MKALRTVLLLLCLLSLLGGALSASAAQIYLPDPDEVGDYDTDRAVVTFYETDGTLNTDRVPRPVDVKEDILKPTLLYGAGATTAYILLRIIRYGMRRWEDKMHIKGS